MPDARRHLKQAKSNENFDQQAFQDGPFYDWQITVCFYTALHLIEAYLANAYKLHSRNHGQRRDHLKEMARREPRKQKVWDRYKDLYDMSIMARYKCLTLTLQDVRDAKEILEFIDDQLCLPK